METIEDFTPKARRMAGFGFAYQWIGGHIKDWSNIINTIANYGLITRKPLFDEWEQALSAQCEKDSDGPCFWPTALSSAIFYALGEVAMEDVNEFLAGKEATA